MNLGIIKVSGKCEILLRLNTTYFIQMPDDLSLVLTINLYLFGDMVG